MADYHRGRFRFRFRLRLRLRLTSRPRGIYPQQSGIKGPHLLPCGSRQFLETRHSEARKLMGMWLHWSFRHDGALRIRFQDMRMRPGEKSTTLGIFLELEIKTATMAVDEVYDVLIIGAGEYAFWPPAVFIDSVPRLVRAHSRNDILEACARDEITHC